MSHGTTSLGARLRVVVTAILLASTALVLGTSEAATAANPALSVDLSYSLGAVGYGASGSLFAVSQDGTPSDDKLSGIKLQSTGQMAPNGKQHPDGDANKIAPEFFRQNGQELQVYIQDYYAGFPYPNPGINAYLNTVTTVVNSVKNQPNASKYVLVPFNEPDNIWYSNSGQGLINLQNDWKSVYQRIRSLWPQARIAGPSFFHYDSAAYRSFFTFAKNNGVLPNLTTWHELTTDFFTGWYDRYNDYRAMENSVGISDIPININEYGRSTGDRSIPGQMINYIARLDATRVAGNMASWDKIGDIGQTLTRDFRKDAAWYLYRWYGERTGTQVRVTPPSSSADLQGTASLSRTKQQASVIVGGANGTNDVAISGFSSTSMGSTVRVVVSGLTNTGRNPSAGPTTLSQRDYAVSGGRVTVTIPNMVAANAYQVTVTAGAGNRFDPNRLYRLTNVNSGKALDDYDHGTVDGSSVDQYTFGETDGHQRWYLVNEGAGYYKVVNGFSGKTLDVSNASTADLAPVVQWTWTYGDNQLWRITDTGNGRYSLINKRSGKALDVLNASKADLAPVGQYAYSGGTNQLWTIF